MFKRFLFIALFSFLILAGSWYFLYPILTEKPLHAKGSALAVGTELNPSQALIAFNLTDSENQPFNQNRLLGKWTLLFFGYTECPEICPKTLGVMSNVWPTLVKYKPNHPLQFVFVSLDPKSDNPTSLKKFLTRFNSSFIGLTGDEHVIQKLKENCRIYSYLDPKLSKPAQKMIDHSATILLINPEGKIQALFSPPHQVKPLLTDLSALIN